MARASWRAASASGPASPRHSLLSTASKRNEVMAGLTRARQAVRNACQPVVQVGPAKNGDCQPIFVTRKRRVSIKVDTKIGGCTHFSCALHFCRGLLRLPERQLFGVLRNPPQVNRALG